MNNPQNKSNQIWTLKAEKFNLCEPDLDRFWIDVTQTLDLDEFKGQPAIQDRTLFTH